MKMQEAQNYLYDQAKKQGAQQFDIIIGESHSTGVEVFEGKVKTTEISASRGIGIRLFANGRPGYAFTEKFSSEALTQTVADALSHTNLTDPLKLEVPGPAELPDIDLDQYHESIDDVSVNDLISLGMELESTALSLNKSVVNVPYLGAGKSMGYSTIVNSSGVQYSSRSNSMYAGLGVVSAKGETRKMGVYQNSARRPGMLDVSFMATKAVERSMELLDAKPISSEALPVVFSNLVSPQILGMFSSPYFAEVVQKGQSRLEGKKGTQIASDKFTLLCDPHIKGYPGSRLFDGEGVVCNPVTVVDKGVLNGFLYNLESAAREGCASSGHGARSYSGPAGTGFSNFIVPLGQQSLQDLLSVFPRCFHVIKLEGGSGCSAVSGEISIGAQGFLVENGKVVQAVEGVTLSTNYFDMLKGIQAFSNIYSDTVSSVKVPDVLVELVNISG